MPETALVFVGERHLALIDLDDLPLVIGRTWHALEKVNTTYAYARIGNRTTYLHRLVAKTPPGLHTDHRNGNGLDNRRENLRIATRSQNKANVSPPRGRRAVHRSQFKGVHWDAHAGKWRAMITVDTRGRHIGLFADERAAALAYDIEAFKVWGEFAQLNLLGQSERAA